MADQPTALQRAVSFLARREHSQQELRAKLVAREYAQREIEQAMEKLLEKGLQSDERFTGAYVQSRVQRGHGPVKISAELKQRGIDNSLISLVLDSGKYDWFALLGQCYEKKYADSKPADYREITRRLRFLQQRGFSAEHCRAIVERYT